MRRLTFLAVLTFASVACATSTPEDDADGDPAATEAAVSGPKAPPAKSINLLYEGTCDFLHSCSSWSKKLPGTQVMWGCTGAAECVDDELWVAGPTRAYCNKKVRLCNGDRCATALVRDISVSQDWEASNGVLDKLGLPHQLVGKCGGRGGGQVKAIYPAPPEVESE